MNFFSKFFEPKFTIQTYQGAGCLFTDNKQVLAGFQQKGSYISGLGGRREYGENYHETAIRETVEELFDITPCEELIEELKTINYSKKFMNGSYVVLVYSFDDLFLFIQITKKHVGISKLYTEFPENILDLIYKRKIKNASEVQQLYLLPLNKELSIDKQFIKDLSLL
jgi:hypothetical protein